MVESRVAVLMYPEEPSPCVIEVLRELMEPPVAVDKEFMEPPIAVDREFMEPPVAVESELIEVCMIVKFPLMVELVCVKRRVGSTALDVILI